MKYRKKPIVIDAIQFDPKGIWPECVKRWATLETPYQPKDCSWGYIDTLEGKMHVQSGDWIVKGVEGEYYPVKDEIFRKTYEQVDK